MLVIVCKKQAWFVTATLPEMEGVVQAGKWREYHVLYLIKLTDAAQRKAIAVYAACKPKITHIVHNIKTKFLGGGGGYPWDIHEQKS